MAPRETENNAYAKFWGDKQIALWYIMVFSGVVNCVPIILKFLTNRNIALIHSVTICEQKPKDCARSGSFQNITYSTIVFNFDIF